MQEAFTTACARGDANAVRELLADSRVDPCTYDCWSLRSAAGRGHTEVVRVLLADSRFDYAIRYTDVVCVAARSGRAELMRTLLADGRADPADWGNAAIRSAVFCDHVEVTRLLLADHRVDAGGAIPCAMRKCSYIFAADERFGIHHYRDLYTEHHPDLVRQYDAMISQCLTMAWLARGIREGRALAKRLGHTWSDIVWPLSDRLKAGCFEQLDE